MSQRLKLSIIGTGNVAYQLGTLFQRKGFTIAEIYSRSSQSANDLALKLQSKVEDSLALLSGDIILVCIKDDALQETLPSIPDAKKVVYTSGSMHLNYCGRAQNTGVLYPLQTLQRNQTVSADDFPILVEAQNSDLLHDIRELASTISGSVVNVTSDDRIIYHLSAVWLNNFTNHMVYMSKKILDERGLDFSLLRSLLLETTEKMKNSNPKDAQTGPARRHDERILALHQSLLSGTQRELYEKLSLSILETYKSDDRL